MLNAIAATITIRSRLTSCTQLCTLEYGRTAQYTDCDCNIVPHGCQKMVGVGRLCFGPFARSMVHVRLEEPSRIRGRLILEL